MAIFTLMSTAEGYAGNVKDLILDTVKYTWRFVDLTLESWVSGPI
jgi:hypothetical protein